MGHLSKIFEKLPIEVQKRNGFDLSHINCGTAQCGQLTPVLKRLLMPNTKFSLGCSMNVELPPLATNFFGRIDAVVEVFFVPCSILYGGWRQFISNQLATMFPDNQDAIKSAGGYVLPVAKFSSAGGGTYPWLNVKTLDATCDSLADYLGLSSVSLDSGAASFYLSLLPFLAYHRICSVFYRNTQVTKDWFAVNPNPVSASSLVSENDVDFRFDKNVSYIWHSFYTEVDLQDSSQPASFNGSSQRIYNSVASNNVFDTQSQCEFPDGVSVFEMRQRPWARDYFTSAMVEPQQGDAPIMKLSVDTDVNEASLSISMIRAANSLQKFVEHNGLSMDYTESMFTHFGVRPSDALLDEPMYLGRLVVPVYQKTVYQQTSTNDAAASSNPLVDAGSLGAKGASGSMVGEGSIVDNFHVKCFGYLMGLFSLVPHTMYNYGIDRDLFRTQLGDFPFPELQSVGMDSIKNYEVYFDGAIDNDDFAYTQRYAYEKYINDQAHGLLRPGKSLESFVLQRSFTSAPEFGTEFTLIPKDALDKVYAVSQSERYFDCWYEIFWVFKASMPLAEYCIPTLGDLKDTYTVHTTQGGSRL